MENLKNRTPEEIIELYDMVQDELNRMFERVQEKSGYYITGKYSLFADDPKKCMDIDLRIAMLENPHEEDKSKLEYYIKVNPDNVIDKPIYAHEHNSWYMIYDGVHRTLANNALGNKTVKANIIVPMPKRK